MIHVEVDVGGDNGDTPTFDDRLLMLGDAGVRIPEGDRNSEVVRCPVSLSITKNDPQSSA
jgi:hypothetical protein